MLRNLFRLGTTPKQLSQRARIFSTAHKLYRHVGLNVEDPPHAGTIGDVHDEMFKRWGLDRSYTPNPESREHLLEYEPEPENLPPRCMRDSLSSVILPLSTDARLRDMYMGVIGNVRLGRLMEDMDMMAVWCCHKHLLVPSLPEDVPLPYSFVTIMVDKITFSDYRTAGDLDVRIAGHVSHVGSSSLECILWLDQKRPDGYKRITHAIFLMAARNATNTAPAPFNPLHPADDEEKRIMAEAEERSKLRKKSRADCVLKVEPNEDEQSLMYELFTCTNHAESMELNKQMLPPNARWMKDSCVTTMMASFPEHRNANNTVFGGFLMRSALEINRIAGWTYAKKRPRFRHMVDISFHKAVRVAAYMRMSAYVVYTEGNYLQLMTVADVLDPSEGTHFTSNVFYCTLLLPDPVPQVLPQTYHESLWYIQGRRKFKFSVGEEL